MLSCALLLVVFNSNTAPNLHTTTTASEKVTSASGKPAEVTSGLPVRFMIPKLAVDAEVLYMGLTPDGDMAVPDNNFKDVGWYQYGARPGDAGTAVVAGHVNGRYERGVFVDLHKLVNGDIVKILDDKNKSISFAVRDIRTYDQDDQPEEVFHSSDGTHLNLITCAGEWNASEQRFPVRLVVFADKIESP